MASRNDELYGYYLMAHIYSGGNCGDIAPQEMGRQSYPSADVRGNDAKAAVALGQMHGRAGTEALSIDRLIATIGALVTEYSTKTVDLSAAKVAMKNVVDTGKAASEAAKPNEGDLADMKAATQGLGALDEKLLRLRPWVVGLYNTGDDTTVLDQVPGVLAGARARGEIGDGATIYVSVRKDEPALKGATSARSGTASGEAVNAPGFWSPLHKGPCVVAGVSADWLRTLGEVTEKSLMDDHRIATIARSETGKSEADDVIGAIRSMAQRDHVALALSLQIMPLNNTIKLRDDIRVSLGFAEPSLPEWVKPGAWAFFPKGSGKGDYLQIIEIARDNVIFRLPMGRTLMCPNGVVRIATRGLGELEWVIERAAKENLPISQMVAVFERELANSEAFKLV